jgi:hypothetical protein
LLHCNSRAQFMSGMGPTRDQNASHNNASPQVSYYLETYRDLIGMYADTIRGCGPSLPPTPTGSFGRHVYRRGYSRRSAEFAQGPFCPSHPIGRREHPGHSLAFGDQALCGILDPFREGDVAAGINDDEASLCRHALQHLVISLRPTSEILAPICIR